eukprot:1177805-Rhodomonas_salina.2
MCLPVWRALSPSTERCRVLLLWGRTRCQRSTTVSPPRPREFGRHGFFAIFPSARPGELRGHGLFAMFTLHSQPPKLQCGKERLVLPPGFTLLFNSRRIEGRGWRGTDERKDRTGRRAWLPTRAEHYILIRALTEL